VLEYDVVDVFTDRPFAGNQLAVVHGAEELDTGQCLALAREFGYSETTFPSTAAGAGAGEYATRIFTPAGEIPFAGHPTLGTAWVLRSRGSLAGEEVAQLCGAGRVDVRFHEGGRVELSATPRDVVGPLDDEVVGSLLADVGLSTSDLTGPVYAAGCGLTFVHLPVVAAAVSRATISNRPLSEYADRLAAQGETSDPVEGINVAAVGGSAPSLRVSSRVFVPGLSVPEDPATGSAAAGLGVALVAAGVLPAGGDYVVTQGVEMGRPSTLYGRVEGDDGVAVRCHVAGHVQPVARGEIAVPPRSAGS